MANTRMSVHVYYKQRETVDFLKLRLIVQRSSAVIYDDEFQTEGALTLNAFTDSASAIRGTVSNNLSDDGNVRAGR